jgi:hypothetical protein
MRYDIHYTGITETRLGFEIQPPLDPTAVQGLLNDIVYTQEGFGGNGLPLSQLMLLG